jgi:hypothetical protein
MAFPSGAEVDCIYCLPSPCARLSRARTTTKAPPLERDIAGLVGLPGASAWRSSQGSFVSGGNPWCFRWSAIPLATPVVIASGLDARRAGVHRRSRPSEHRDPDLATCTACLRLHLRTEASNTNFNLRDVQTRVLHHDTCGSSSAESSKAIATNISRRSAFAARSFQPLSEVHGALTGPGLIRARDGSSAHRSPPKLRNAPIRDGALCEPAHEVGG